MKLKKWIIKTKGMSQREFAIKMNVGEAHLSRWLNGTNIPSLHNAMKIEKLTKGEVTAEDLLPALLLKGLKEWYKKAKL